MTKRMLIDASHPEETRVAILDGNRLEAFDFESATKKQIKGNIYLAKVTRVEPSLQACFVDYGGNRQGFLAFSEIHPDYYQIPIADREALMAEDEEESADGFDAAPEPQQAAEGESIPSPEGEALAEGEENTGGETAETAETAAPAEPIQNETQGNSQGIETMGGDEAEEARQFRKMKFYRKYKIQEVIKRRQILLVQIVKEERGAKGAAMTSYISLPGRYCVLMPNSARSGVSRKISNYQDRRRMKSLISSLEVPDGMAVILRTAGADRPKTDIKRDCDYLLKLWDEIRDNTLKSTAPAMIYEEGSLVKRAIRDLYTRDIEHVIIEGDEGYKAAKNLMKVLTPSHAKRVQQFKDKASGLFHKYQVENQIHSIHDTRVDLPAGGYIVINQTEALVAIDVNSGRSTRERNIEETAVRTNIEAAEEIARQMRLRDLAGLIVVDFIDMENHGNKNRVERTFKEAVRKDRARMQIGRISHFGLLELTRQRLRPSVLEGSSSKCPTCNGMGTVRSTESSALSILRAIEDDLVKRKSSEIRIFVAASAGLYLLNQKRAALAAMEAEHSTKILMHFDDTLVPPAYRIERVRADGDDGENRDHRGHDEVESKSDSSSDNSGEQRDQQQSRGQNRDRDHHRGGRRDRHRDRDRGRNRGHDQNRDQNRGRHNEKTLAESGSESMDDNIGNVDVAETVIDDNIGNVESGQNTESRNRNNEDRQGGRRRDRFRRRGRGGRDRFRDRNDRPRGGQDGQNVGAPNHNGGAPDNTSFGSDNNSYISEARHESPDFEDREPQATREVYNAPRVEEQRPEPAPIPDNVELVTGSPSNPKRGWWRKMGGQ